MIPRSLFVLPYLIVAVSAQFANADKSLEPRAPKTLKPGAPCSFEGGPKCQDGSVCSYTQDFKSVCSMLSPEISKNQPCKSDSNCPTGRCVIIGDGRKVCGPARLGNKCFAPLDCQSNICTRKAASDVAGVCSGNIGQGGFCDLSDRKPCPDKTPTDPNGGPSYKLQCSPYNGDAGLCVPLPASGKFKKLGQKCSPFVYPSQCEYGCSQKFPDDFDTFVCSPPAGGSSCKSNADCSSGYCNTDPGFQPTCYLARTGHPCYSSYDCFSTECIFKNKDDKLGKCGKANTYGTCVVEKGVNECKTGKCVIFGQGTIGACQ